MADSVLLSALIMIPQQNGLPMNLICHVPFKGAANFGKRMPGKGIAKEAVLLILDYYFNYLRYHRCGIHIYDYNPHSIYFHEKMGFQKCGQLHEAQFFKGEYHDTMLYEMIAHEFNGKRNAL